MSNSIGVIFHKDWKDFSPFMYSHYGADYIPYDLQDFLKEYYSENNIEDYTDGHKFNPCHMLVGFLQYIDKDIDTRVVNLNDIIIKKLKNIHEYDNTNCFDGGCWLINISNKHYGETIIENGKYSLNDNNLFLDELKRNEYDY